MPLCTGMTTTTMIMSIVMDEAALYRLMAWLSPSYPVGAFAYSHGLEHAVEAGTVSDKDTMMAWIDGLLLSGSGRTDARLFRRAYDCVTDGDMTGLSDVADLGRALAPSLERRLETLAQGQAFRLVTVDAWATPALVEILASLPTEIPYPVVVGAATAAMSIPLQAALSAYLHAFATNIISAGVRVIPLGQTDGQRAAAALEASVAEAVRDALSAAEVTEFGSAGILSDIASMQHETQFTRLFRS